MNQPTFPWKSGLLGGDAELLEQIFAALNKGLPSGFELSHSAVGMAWVVPFSLYPSGYHCPPPQPLPFMSVRVQKSHVALHHLGLYASSDLTQAFVARLISEGLAKPDMGKGCFRIKRNRPVPTASLSWLAEQLTVSSYIELYESGFI